MSIACSLLILFAQGNFEIYALAMIYQALSYNFDSGTSAAMLYESSVEAGLQERYLAISSFLSGVAEVTRTLGTVLAGFFVHGNLAGTYYISIALSLLSLGLICLMKESHEKEAQDRVDSMYGIL